MTITPIEILIPIAILSCGIGFIAADRVGFKTARWGYALCSLGIGYTIMLVQISRISTIKQAVEDIFIILGVVLGSRALRMRYGLAPKLYFEMSVFISTILMIATSLAVFQSIRLETLFAQIGCTILLWEASITASRYTKSTSDKILNGTFMFLSLAMTGQCLLYIMAPEIQQQAGAWRESVWGSLVQYTGLLASIILAFAVMISHSTDSIEKHRLNAGTDTLTNLLNRRGLDAALSAAHADPLWEKPAALIVTDIDHFKRINDQFGHPFGDTVITRFAQLLKAHAGSHTLTARLGGEEFLALLPNTDLDSAMIVADEIRQTFAQERWHKLANVSFTASFGVTLAHPDEPLSSTIDRADRLLYVAKNNGRNCTIGCDESKNFSLQAARMTITQLSNDHASASG